MSAQTPYKESPLSQSLFQRLQTKSLYLSNQNTSSSACLPPSLQWSYNGAYGSYNGAYGSYNGAYGSYNGAYGPYNGAYGPYNGAYGSYNGAYGSYNGAYGSYNGAYGSYNGIWVLPPHKDQPKGRETKHCLPNG